MRTIVAVEEIGGYRLRLHYSGGGSADVDFSDAIARGGVCAPLAEPMLFKRFFIGEDGRSLEWPDEIGFCADALWFKAHPHEYAAYLQEAERRGLPVAG